MFVSFVVASRNRPELLRRLLDSVVPQLASLGDEYEVIVVDDGSEPPYEAGSAPEVTMVRTNGGGPARARNRGVARSSGEVVLFSDDDVVIEPGWVAAALGFLSANPDHAGVTGATVSPPHDPIYEHSVEDLVGGSFLTCNVAYRREALVAVGGFDRLFSHAHEDRDLAWRVIDQVGPVGFESSMRVTHPGRPFSLRAGLRRAEFIFDDWLLFARYPERRAGRRSIRWTPVANTARTWRNVARGAHLWRRPSALVRWCLLTTGLLVRGTWLAMTRWNDLKGRDVRAVGGLRHAQRRLAYVGPSPHPEAGGAPGVAGLLLEQLLERGYSVDCFVAASREDDDPRGLGEHEALSYVVARSSFAFGRWYSRTRLTKMISLQVFAGMNRRRLSQRLAALHAASPYDFVYQFSTFESFGVPRVPGLPVLIHPSVHAAGERRWMIKEAPLQLSDDGAWRRFVVTSWLQLRVWRQRRDATRATGVLALSNAFAAEIGSDYGVDAHRIRVVPNCIDVADINRVDPTREDLVVVGRLVVRKGLEDVAALSHRLATIDSKLRLRVIGSPSLWSDYRRALASADATVTSIEGSLAREQVFAEVGGSLALLQLSRYEPFGLTVAEALALGVPVVVTPAVGAAESLASDVKIVVQPHDIDAIAAAVASLAELREDERVLLSHRCRREAETHFAPSVVADVLELAINDLIN